LENHSNLSDSEIITKIKQGAHHYEEMANYLFEAFQGFITTVNEKLHLPTWQIRDAYTDSIIKLLRQIRNGQFKGDSKLSTYFYSIFYNTAVDVSRKNTTNKNINTTELAEYDLQETQLLDLAGIEEDARQLMMQMDSLGALCKKVLIEWGYYGYPMEEIALRNELSNADSARSIKYKCLKRLRENLTQV